MLFCLLPERGGGGSRKIRKILIGKGKTFWAYFAKGGRGVSLNPKGFYQKNNRCSGIFLSDPGKPGVRSLGPEALLRLY